MADLSGRRDLLAGFVLAAGGAFVVQESSHYALGTVGRMGPGFYPAILGIGMVAIGALIALNRDGGVQHGGAQHGDAQHGGGEHMGGEHWAGEHGAAGRLDWRGGGCIVAGVLAFLVLGEYAGFAPAAFACVFVSALGDRTATLRGSAALALGATVLGVLLFSYALQIQLPVWRLGAAP